jgi:hypothetical protein
MSPISDLPADRQAVLSLLVKQRRSYDQVAAMLKIEPDAVRTRALDAVDMLGGPAPSGISDDERSQIADYLLGQLDESERIETLALLLDTAPGRGWARRVAAELEPIAGDTLPAVPDDPDEPTASAATTTWDDEEDDDAVTAAAPTRPARRPRAPAAAPTREARRRQARDAEPAERTAVSRGGAVLAAAAALIVAAIVVAIVNSSSSSSLPTGPIPASAATATASSTTTTAAGTGTGTGATGTSGVSAEIALKATAAGGHASAAVAVVNASAGPELAFTAKSLSTPPAGDEYVLWLYNSATQFHALGVLPSPTTGSVSPVAVALPSDAGTYSGVIVTLESTNRPSKPGTVVLEGASTSPL